MDNAAKAKYLADIIGEKWIKTAPTVREASGFGIPAAVYIEEVRVNLEIALNEAAANPQHPHDGPCYICGVFTQCVAGNPSLWPIWLGWRGGNGKSRPHHMGCVIRRLEWAEHYLSASGRDEHELEGTSCCGPTDHSNCSACGPLRYDADHPHGKPEPMFGTHIREAIAVLKDIWKRRKDRRFGF